MSSHSPFLAAPASSKTLTSSTSPRPTAFAKASPLKSTPADLASILGAGVQQHFRRFALSARRGADEFPPAGPSAGGQENRQEFWVVNGVVHGGGVGASARVHEQEQHFSLHVRRGSAIPRRKIGGKEDCPPTRRGVGAGVQERAGDFEKSSPGGDAQRAGDV